MIKEAEVLNPIFKDYVDNFVRDLTKDEKEGGYSYDDFLNAIELGINYFVGSFILPTMDVTSWMSLIAEISQNEEAKEAYAKMSDDINDMLSKMPKEDTNKLVESLMEIVTTLKEDSGPDEDDIARAVKIVTGEV